MSYSISVIIPCHNVEKTIIKTIKSLEYQSYRDFEVIIIDDGSSDNTSKIIKDIITNSNLKFKFISQENSGVSNARNQGIKLATGEYICFLDADDIYHSHMLSLSINYLKKYNCDTAFSYFSRDLEYIKSNHLYEAPIKTTLFEKQDLLAYMLYKKTKISFANFLYKKKIVDKLGLKFNAELKYGEDILFLWTYLINCNSGILIEKEFYGYYENSHSAVNNINWRFTDSLKAIKIIESQLESVNHPILINYQKYTYQREIWRLLKEFAIFKRKDLYIKMIDTYKVKKFDFDREHVGILIWSTALVYNINPLLFYNLVRTLCKLNIYKYFKK